MNCINKTMAFILAIIVAMMIYTACDKEIPPSPNAESNSITNIKSDFEEGIDFYNNGDFDEAVLFLESAVVRNPDRAEIYIALADAYVAVNRGNYAVTVLQNALEEVKNKDAVKNKIKLLEKDGYGQSEIVDMIREEKFDADNRLVYSIRYYYDDSGRLIKTVSSDANGENSENVIYKYNEKNLLISETTYNADKSYKGHTEYSYDNNDNLACRVVVNNTGRLEFHYKYNKDNTLICMAFGHELGEGRYEYTYDSKGNLIHEVWYDSMTGGNLVGTYDYTYNDKGIRIREDEYNPDGSLYSYTIYEEDEKGRARNMAHHYPDGTLHTSCDVNSYEYDDNDRLIKMGIYDKDANSRGYISYTYDFINK